VGQPGGLGNPLVCQRLRPRRADPPGRAKGKAAGRPGGCQAPPVGPRAEGPSGLKAGVPWVQAGARPWRNQGLGLTRRRTRPPALPKQPLAGPCHRSRHTGGVLREELEQVKVWPSREFAKSRYLRCGTANFATLALEPYGPPGPRPRVPKGVLSGLARVGARENWRLAKLLLYYPAC
jgi:hypothetical protein